ncbi:ABC transporter ATP-binding protein [Paenibacillus lautus]|uniref:ABC transporter ATP-binding protein n=1 Tax=Paenibacillus lautus TaxID=1401 RepID=UPI003D2C5980
MFENITSLSPKQIFIFLYNRLGSDRFLLITGIVLCMSQSICMLLIPFIMNIYFNNLQQDNYNTVKLLISFSIILFIILTGLLLLGIYLRQKCISKLEANLMFEIAHKVHDISYEKYRKFHSSDLVQRITQDSKTTVSVFTLALDKLTDQMLMLVLATVYMLILNWRIGVFILIVSPLMLLISHAFRNKLKRMGLDISSQEATIREIQQDSLRMADVAKVYGVLDWIVERFDSERRTLNRLYMKKMLVEQAIFLSSNIYSNTLVIAIMVYVGWTSIDSPIALGAMIAFFSLVWNVNSPLESISSLWASIQEGVGSSSRIFNLLRIEEREDKHRRAKQNYGEVNDVEIEIKDVTFSYMNDEKSLNNEKSSNFILQPVNLEFRRGSITAIVGQSGSGKSTVAKLIAGLLSPDTGEINYYLTNKSQKQLKDVIAYVSQSPYLFSGSIRDNLLLVINELNEENFRCVSDIAQLDFISSLSEGLDTAVLESGLGLSGGQRQRIAIAQALLADRDILVFDEATSQLDVKTERRMVHALFNYVKQCKKTLIFITHRLDTIEIADQVIIMEDGMVQEQGAPFKIIQNGLYSNN